MILKRGTIDAFYYHEVNNVGDMLTVPIFKHFGIDVTLVSRNRRAKWLAVGSIMRALREGDIIWGTGCIVEGPMKAPKGCKFLAVRGPLTRSMISNAVVPEIYGDPALLLPLVYNPVIEITHETGYVPHYVDKRTARAVHPETNKTKHIDVQADWQTVIREIKGCEKIISSSLHGIIIAEAYGIPAVWTKYSDNIIGGDFKYQDYFLGTDRERQVRDTPLSPIDDLEAIQARLIEALKSKLTLTNLLHEKAPSTRVSSTKAI